jgi:hypothetical protein
LCILIKHDIYPKKTNIPHPKSNKIQEWEKPNKSTTHLEWSVVVANGMVASNGFLIICDTNNLEPFPPQTLRPRYLLHNRKKIFVLHFCHPTLTHNILQALQTMAINKNPPMKTT